MSSSPVIAESTVAPVPLRPTVVERWPSERPLFVVSLTVSIVLWIALAITGIGLLYALVLGVFFFLGHVAFVTHVRGSAIRLGPDQLPELHARVTGIARAIGMERVPDTYLMQAGGALNAFATRFLGTNFVVLFSDLLEACGDDESARDMIIAHELGHIRAGHVRWHWLLLPSKLVPFLGGALSRAREYTCDRFGLVGAGDREGALLGLTILASGGTHARLVNRGAFVRQREDLNTGWMRIGEWMGSHPPLARRLAALDLSLGGPTPSTAAGTLRALLILVGGWLLFLLAAAAALAGAASLARQVEGDISAESAGFVDTAPQEATRIQLDAAFAAISSFLIEELSAGRALPASDEELIARWQEMRAGTPFPADPFSGEAIAYARYGRGFILSSNGPDGVVSADDVHFGPVGN